VGRIAELVGQHAADRGAICKVRAIVNEYAPDERAEWIEALADADIPTTQIQRAFRSDGRDIAFSTVTRHRRGECACG
jgi:hypothetical protein